MEFYYFLLLVSIVLGVCKSCLYNSYAKQTTPTLESIFGFNSISYGVAALISFCIFIFSQGTISAVTVLCAFFYAAIVFSLQTVSVSAMKDGAMSLTAICVMYGMIIPSLAGPIFWHEPFGTRQAIGIALMMVSLGLLGINKGDSTQKISKKWIILAVLCFVLSGMAGVMEKIHQSTDGKDDKAGFVLIACLFMFAFSVALRIFSSKSESFKDKITVEKPILIFGALSGMVIGAYSIVNLTLAGGIDSVIYYPVANGGALLLTVFVSRFLYKEPFNIKKISGIAMGLLGIILLSIN